MSEAKPGAPAKRGRRDRWGMRPPRRGRVRGQIRNVSRSFGVSEYGNIIIVDFDLFIDDDLPLVPVRMRGTDFPIEPQEGQVVDVRDPAPDVRPIEATRLDFPPHYQHEVVAYYPGRDDIPQSRQRMNGLMVIIGPIVVTVAAIGLFLAIYG